MPQRDEALAPALSSIALAQPVSTLFFSITLAQLMSTLFQPLLHCQQA
jgi:hypothetical protein